MKIARLVFALAALAFGSTGWGQGALYPLFGPSSGIMVGDPATPVTSSATSANVLSLWSGTCSGSTFLNGAGVCTTPAGTGVTSVAQTVPAGFAISGSPITSTGTLAISYATGQTANLFLATPNGSTGALSERAIVGADLPPINLASTANGGVLSTSILLGTNGGTSNGFFSITGPTTSLKTFTFPNASATVLTTNAAVTVAQGGTGAATLTGLLKGNGTSAFTAAASSDVISLWTGTCSSTTFLRGDGACASAGGGAVGGANTNVQFNNSGVFGGDSGFTYAGASGGVGIVGLLTLNHSGSVAAGALLLSVSGQADLTWQVTGAAADQKNWDITTSTTQMVTRACNDALSTCRTLWSGTRSGVGLTDITIGNATDNAPVTLAGTGGLTVGVPAGNSQSINVKGSAVGASNLGVVAFVDSGGTRTGYVGDSSSGDSNIVLECDTSPCNVVLAPTGTGQILGPGSQPVNGSLAWTAAYVGNGGVSLGSVVAVSSYVACADLPGSAVGASSATTFSVGTLPAAARPVHPQTVQLPPTAEDNGVIAGFTFTAIVNTNGTVTFLKNNSTSGWTASNQKGVTTDTTMCYFLN